MAILISEADLDSARDAAAVIMLLDAYSQDPMGDGAPLPESVKAALIPGLRAHPTTLVFLAWDGEAPVGIATCFLGFSTLRPNRWSISTIWPCSLTGADRASGHSSWTRWRRRQRRWAAAS